MPDEGAAKTPSTPASPAPATPVAKVTPPPPVATTPARDGLEIRLGAGYAISPQALLSASGQTGTRNDAPKDRPSGNEAGGAQCSSESPSSTGTAKS